MKAMYEIGLFDHMFECLSELREVCAVNPENGNRENAILMHKIGRNGEEDPTLHEIYDCVYFGVKLPTTEEGASVFESIRHYDIDGYFLKREQLEIEEV